MLTSPPTCVAILAIKEERYLDRTCWNVTTLSLHKWPFYPTVSQLFPAPPWCHPALVALVPHPSHCKVCFAFSHCHLSNHPSKADYQVSTITLTRYRLQLSTQFVWCFLVKTWNRSIPYPWVRGMFFVYWGTGESQPRLPKCFAVASLWCGVSRIRLQLLLSIKLKLCFIRP